ncbi:MAG: CRISPR-associated protein Cas4 [Acidobacteriota bacterium]|nr:CRISPR-associated protein Cas4 [Acidobacteriota bacterium]
MNLSAFFPFILAAAFLLGLAAMAMLALSNYLRRQSGLPEGEVVYEDASGQGRELFSKRLGLSGKPDYLLEDTEGNLIPVEVKSGYAPRGDRPYESHRLQIAAYLLLVEEVLQRTAAYGLIRYRNRTLRVDYTDELHAELMDTIDQMRTLLARGEAHRSHNHPQRCMRCSMAHACDERLA